MQKIVKKIFSAPSIRLNTFVLIEVVMLLVVSLGVLFYFTRQALVEECKKDAEHRLEGAVQHVDNVLLSVEQSAGNFFYEMLEHLDQPELMKTYCQRLVECNPYIQGCAIGFEPDYYPNREQCFSYVYRRRFNLPDLIISDRSVIIPYTKQNWYSETMKRCRPAWTDPGQNKDYKVEPVITFCLPIQNHAKKCVGVMAVGVSVNLLSQIVLDTKPTTHSYTVLLSDDGSYIVHPDREKLAGKTIFEQPDIAASPTAMQSAKSMVEGNTGDMSFLLNGEDWHMFYKPFVRTAVPGRSVEPIKWSIATIYPYSDIFGEYNHLVVHVLYIVLGGLLVFYVLCRIVIRMQVKPLSYLTVSAERIAEGHYDETIPDTKRNDEVGIFQQHFQHMQQALVSEVSKQEELKAKLQSHREELEKTLRQMEEDNDVKVNFLHNVTDQMLSPAEAVVESVNTLCDRCEDITLDEANREIDNIKQQSATLTRLLSQKISASASEARKEDRHE